MLPVHVKIFKSKFKKNQTQCGLHTFFTLSINNNMVKANHPAGRERFSSENVFFTIQQL